MFFDTRPTPAGPSGHTSEWRFR